MADGGVVIMEVLNEVGQVLAERGELFNLAEQLVLLSERSFRHLSLRCVGGQVPLLAEDFVL